MNCSACCADIAVDEKEYLRCTVRNCYKTYHHDCTGEKNLKPEDLVSWICPECRCASKKGGDNSHTPVGVTKRHRDANVTIRQKVTRVHNGDGSGLVDEQDCNYEIRELRNELTKIREQLSQSHSLIDIYKSQIELSVSVIANYDKKLGQSVSVIVSCEARIEKYADQMKNLADQLKKYEKRGLETIEHLPETLALHSAKTPTEAQRPAQIPLRSAPACVPEMPPSTPAPLLELSPKQPRAHIPQRAPRPDHTPRLSHRPSRTTVNVIESAPASYIEPLETSANEDWIEVRHKKQRQSMSLRCVAGPAVTSLKAAEPRKHLHLWNMVSGADEVKTYLNALYPQRMITVEQLKTSNSYNSFKIGVPEDCYDNCFSINVWPENARVKKWVNYKRRTPATSENQTFRRGFGSQ